MKSWRIVKSCYPFRSKWLTVRRDHVVLPNGIKMDDFYVLEYPDWINIIAITEDGRFVMERQYRHGIQEVGVELCAGVIEKNENPLDAAKRELYEETGYGGGEWSLYCTTTPNPAAMSNRNFTFIARGVKKVSTQHLELSEDIEVIEFSANELKNQMQNGNITQGIMLAPLWKFYYENKL